MTGRCVTPILLTIRKPNHQDTLHYQNRVQKFKILFNICKTNSSTWVHMNIVHTRLFHRQLSFCLGYATAFAAPLCHVQWLEISILVDRQLASLLYSDHSRPIILSCNTDKYKILYKLWTINNIYRAILSFLWVVTRHISHSHFVAFWLTNSDPIQTNNHMPHHNRPTTAS